MCIAFSCSIYLLSCCCISVLHENRLTHTDLKPENILFVNSDSDITYDPVKVGLGVVSGIVNVIVANALPFKVLLPVVIVFKVKQWS